MLTVTDVRLRTESGPWWRDWRTWFALPVRRTVQLTVTNTGAEPVTDPAVSVAVGRGTDATTVVYPPRIRELAPGQEAVYKFPVDLPAPVFGSYTVRGEIAGLDESVVFETTATSWPWGLLGTGALLAGYAAMWLLSGWAVALVRTLGRIVRAVSRLRGRRRSPPQSRAGTASPSAEEHAGPR